MREAFGSTALDQTRAVWWVGDVNWEVTAMPRITGDIVIERPVADVFDFVADSRNEPASACSPSNRWAQRPGCTGTGTFP